MCVVGSHQRNARFPGKTDQLWQNHIVLFQTVILQFDVVVSFPEKVLVVQRCLFGTLIVTGQNRLGHFPGQAGRKADQAFVVLFQQFLVHAGLGIKPLQKAGADHLDQVFVAGFIFAEQHKVVVAVNAVDLVESGAGSNIHLAADNGTDTSRHCRIVELHAAIHNAVVGDGHGGLAQLFDAVEQFVDSARTVQQAVFGMQMQMGKLAFCLLRHGFPFLRVPAARSDAGQPVGYA